MTEASPYLDPQVLAQLRGLKLRSRRAFEGHVAGQHRSPNRGFSIEFAAHREYSPGDDLRYLDWKVFGRTDKYYLKEFEAETNLACHLVVDVSESMAYQGPHAPYSKFECAKRTAAALAYVVLHQHDSVGLTTFDRELRSQVPVAGTPSHLGDLLGALPEQPTERKTACGAVFRNLADRLRRRGVVLVLSDCFDDVSSLVTGLKHIAHRRHDVVLIQIVDPAEMEFPFRDPTRFVGLEAWPEVAVDPRSIRQAYREEFAAFLRQVKQGCRMHQVDYLLLRTDQPLGRTLSRFLARRAS